MSDPEDLDDEMNPEDYWDADEVEPRVEEPQEKNEEGEEGEEGEEEGEELGRPHHFMRPSDIQRLLEGRVPPHFFQFFGGGMGFPPDFLRGAGIGMGMGDDEAEEPAVNMTGDQVMIAIHQFVDRFQQLYGPVHPPFYMGTFDDAKTTAVQTGKFLCLYLHSDENEEFCREVLCSETVVQLLSENFVTWAWDASSREGLATLRQLLSHRIRDLGLLLPRQFPFLCIMAVINGSLTVLDSSGPTKLEDLVLKLLAVVENHSRVLEEEQEKMRRREADRLAREQIMADQESAYLRSLEEDRLKQLQKEKEEEERRQQELLEEQRRAEQEERVRRLQSSLPPEPTSGEISKLLFRFPDGSKKQRAFLASEPLQVLFDYMETEGCPRSGGFVFQTNFPKRVLSDLDPGRSLKEHGLFPQETIFVQAPS